MEEGRILEGGGRGVFYFLIVQLSDASARRRQSLCPKWVGVG